MYDYGYSYDYGSTAAGVATGFAAVGIIALIIWLIGIAASVLTIVATWKVLVKAGKPGWAAIVPVYNIIVLLEVTELPMWYIALLFVPGANVYATFKIYIDLAKKFGKDVGFGIGLVFLGPVFMSILAFNKDIKYVGASAAAQPAYQGQPVYQNQPAQPAYQSQPVQPTGQEFGQPTNPTAQEFGQPAQPAPTFCTGCGSQLAPNTRFCTSCGKQQ